MMVAPSHLKSLQALELAIRKGSLRAAAETLAITPAAAGQRVKALEDYLGIPLLVRGRGGLRAPTELGGALTHLAAAFRSLDAAVAELDLQRGHEIHVAAEPDFADLWLAPRLAQFQKQHPHVRFNVNGAGDAALRLGPADCEIRFGAHAAGERTDALLRDFLVPVASPSTQRRIMRMKPRLRLEGYPLLHLDFYKDDPEALTWPAWFTRTKLKRTAPERGIRFRRIARALDAVLANAGVTISGIALLRELLESGELTQPFAPTTGAWTSHVFLARYRAEALARPQVRRFRQWLIEECAVTDTWLAQRVEQPH
jgi:LysR family transcriptional regulator, glycine cleavage system transcriptional activator